MRNPTKKQVQKVIDNFMKVLPAAKKLEKETCSVDMGNGTVEKEHPCGTPMCHGGWYVVASFSEKKRLEIYADYEDGARKMAEHLGFEDDYHLKMWADNNPDIWGNDNGYDMFLSKLAFNYKGELTLSKIVAHWNGVQKRLPR